jgi:hypothetical protein
MIDDDVEVIVPVPRVPKSKSTLTSRKLRTNTESNVILFIKKVKMSSRSLSNKDTQQQSSAYRTQQLDFEVDDIIEDEKESNPGTTFRKTVQPTAKVRAQKQTAPTMRQSTLDFSQKSQPSQKSNDQNQSNSFASSLNRRRK